MKQTKKRYTKEESDYLMKCIKESPSNIYEGVRVFLKKYPERTFSSATNKYYHIINTSKNHSVFFTVSKKSAIRNRKVVRKGCKKQEKTTSIWKYICNLFK